MIISGVVMVLAALMFGVVPDTAAAHVATKKATPLPPGTVVHAASCEQSPLQSARDRAAYSDTELARYGLPPRTPGEPFEKWAKIVRNAGERVCDYTVGASSSLFSPAATSTVQYVKARNWAGNVADESTPGQNYTEADMDYFVPCITGTPPPMGNPPTVLADSMSAFIGLGGSNATQDMIQVGTAAYQSNAFILYRVFVENTSTQPGNDTSPHYFFTLNCGDHVYVKVWNGNCMYLQRISDGKHITTQCYGPYNDGRTAQAIVERSAIDPLFANFGAITFKGVGITDNGSYLGMNQVPHYYAEIYDCRWLNYECAQLIGNPLATVGPIQSDPGNPPYDKYSVTWHGYGTAPT